MHNGSHYNHRILFSFPSSIACNYFFHQSTDALHVYDKLFVPGMSRCVFVQLAADEVLLLAGTSALLQCK